MSNNFMFIFNLVFVFINLGVIYAGTDSAITYVALALHTILTHYYWRRLSEEREQD